MEADPRALLVWGAGGHGRVVADIATVTGWRLAGFADADPARVGQRVEPGGARVLVADDELRAHLAEGRLPAGLDAVALGVGSNADRRGCLQQAAAVEVPVLVHPSAVVSPSAVLGRGTVVFPLAAVNAGARIGDGGIVNTGAIVEHDCELGEAVHVSPGAVLGGGVGVGDGSWIGAGATVIHGIRIGVEVVVGAGAVVVRDVPDGTTVIGNPARPLAPRGETA